VRPLTFEEVHNDQILREAIECQAARMCTKNASKAELSALMTKARLAWMPTGGLRPNKITSG
ncbi:MAG TPA: hypothetical protein VMY37_33970, partial [Thermoguttaceae bacterium]|nr:hypothetical protein [Thermoguttaceae bacterium]